MKLSAVILTKNEEENIIDCIESVSFCDEIIVIDDKSEDRTSELAKKAGAKVFSRALDNDFSQQRNFGLEKANGEWVLFVDVDERVTPLLRDEINQLTNQPINQCSGFYLRRTDFMWGRELTHGETGNIKLLRLARKNAGFWEGKVHEVWKIQGSTATLENPLLHYPHQTIEEFLRDINFYTDLRAKELFMQGIHVYWPEIILYPKLKFLLNYFVKLGFLDGIPGLMVAVLMSFHSFLVRGKLWQLSKKS